MSASFQPTERTRLRRKPARGSHDRDVVFGILDAGVICHLGYVVDGQPLCTPTAYWREGDRLYWHGSTAGRMVQAQTGGSPVCLTVSHLDGLVLARSGFTHSVLYRSVMAFGHPTLVSDEAEKRHLLDRFIDRLYPGRTREMRPLHDHELRATEVIGMTIEEASAKIRDGGVVDPAADLDASCWAGVIPIAATIGRIVADARLQPGIPLPPGLAGCVHGARLEDALPVYVRRGARSAG